MNKKHKTIKRRIASPALVRSEAGGTKVDIDTPDVTTAARDVKDFYLSGVAGVVLGRQTEWKCEDGSGELPEYFILSLRESVKPRDVLEEMLVLQMAFTHARIARLHHLAADQVQIRNVQVVHDACDRASNTFRRQLLALAEYRQPARQKTFIVAQQANVGTGQQVSNHETSNFQFCETKNEQGSASLPATALLPVEEGFGIPPFLGVEESTLAIQHRPA